MNDQSSILEKSIKENTRFVAAILHLKYASDLLKDIDNDISFILLQTSDALISKYKISKQEIDELKQIENEILIK